MPAPTRPVASADGRALGLGQKGVWDDVRPDEPPMIRTIGRYGEISYESTQALKPPISTRDIGPRHCAVGGVFGTTYQSRPKP
jgi:hypothetical protein